MPLRLPMNSPPGHSATVLGLKGRSIAFFLELKVESYEAWLVVYSYWIGKELHIKGE
ncbi:MAG: hypothetical protein H0X26_05910 [Alphaproteobacteria bacterium]|nr:hypothetical protein [Alphaproteobacteria bacterium]